MELLFYFTKLLLIYYINLRNIIMNENLEIL
jgi:hypothetical protein